jgi:diguanylate cyclase (GGDEF)-like protein/PAS domain S-box-containing protein
MGASEAVFRALTEQAPVGVFVLDACGGCEFANERACELTGLTLEQSLGDGWEQALHPADAASVLDAWTRARRAGEAFSREHRFRRPDGSITWVEAFARPVHDTAGVLLGWAGTCIDLTDHKLTEARYADLVEHANDAVVTTDRAGNFMSANRAAEAMTGYSRDQLAAMNLFELVVPEDAERIRQLIMGEFERDEPEPVELQIVARGGARIYIEVSARLVNDRGRTVRIEAIARNTTERHDLERRLDHQALHDALTGLPNRVLLADRVGQAIARSRREGSDVVVMLIDLDNLKLVNDSVGHRAGDELLVAVAGRLTGAIPHGATAAHIGGDEFAVLLSGVDGTSEVAALARELLIALAEPYALAAGPLHTSATIGIAFAEDGAGAEALLANGETAMYRAKAAGKGCFELFDAGMRARVRRHMSILNELAGALRTGGLGVHYQPIVALADERPLAVEALVRWQHPEWGWVQPGEFIPLAEDTGLIEQIGDFVLGEAARQICEWRRDYPDALPMGVFVNVSPRQLSQPDFVLKLLALFDRYALAPNDIGIEITEGVFLDADSPVVTANIAALVDAGVKLILDDFGTGYSALGSLKRIPFAALKIDGYFIGAIRAPGDPAPITAAIVGLGHALGVTVIAERVETAVQAERLRSLRCAAAQGYHFARPQPAAGVTALLAAADLGSQRQAA